MRKLVVLASLVALAASSVACGNSSGSNGLLSPSALAANSAAGTDNNGKKPTPTSGALSIVMVADSNGNNAPDHGDQISFTVSTLETWNQVTVVCSQNGVNVYSAVWPLTPALTLSSYAWSSGAANCTASLISFSAKNPILDTLNFAAGA